MIRCGNHLFGESTPKVKETIEAARQCTILKHTYRQAQHDDDGRKGGRKK